jgi:hypothetical protein
MVLLSFIIITQLACNYFENKRWYSVIVFDLLLFSVLVASNFYYWLIFIGSLLVLMGVGELKPNTAFGPIARGLKTFVIGGYKEKENA